MTPANSAAIAAFSTAVRTHTVAEWHSRERHETRVGAAASSVIGELRSMLGFGPGNL